MFRKLKDLLFRRVIGLRAVLITIFMGFFIATIATFLIIFHYNIAGIAMRAELSLLERSSRTVYQKLHGYLKQVDMAAQVSADMINNNVIMVGAHFVANNPEEIPVLDQPILATPKHEDNRRDVMRYSITLLSHLTLAKGVFWGDQTGSFIHALREPDGSITTAIYNRHATPNRYLTIYRDKDGKEIKRSTQTSTYDPRKRPWYEIAKKEKKLIWTQAYPFGGDENTLGITAAAPVYLASGKLRGVFGVDIPLAALSDYVATQTVGREGQVFILDDHGKIIAAKELLKHKKESKKLQKLLDVHDAPIPLLARSFSLYTQDKNPAIRFEFNGGHYLATFMPIRHLKRDNWLIGVVDKESDVKNQLFNIGMEYIAIETIVILIGLLFISKAATMIVIPIKKLVAETDKIKNFDLEKRGVVKSRIKEVFDMSKALVSMKSGLRSFKKYVPAALVRQLIDAGVDVDIGGDKRMLAILFTDIKDFTAISEKYDTNDIMLQVNQYFDVLSHVISNQGGTIDKYIGDSVMAFWGAPAADEEATQHAAKAALEITRQLEPLNDCWIEEGREPLRTRIGINFGEAIVGNVGSSERLNYTALGDAVNMASRLENANKLYGTTILVSEAAYERLKGCFVLRKVDKVQLKGREKTGYLYELLAETIDSVAYDLKAYEEAFELALVAYEKQFWTEAINYFENCLTIHKNDTLAAVFIKRCRHFEQSPPPADWNGIWHFDEQQISG